MFEPKKSSIEEGIHDFFYERPYTLATIGFLPSRNVAIYAYRAWIYFLFFYLQAMSAYAIYLNRHEKVSMINAVHTFLMPSFGVCGLSVRLFTHRSLYRTWEMVRDGIYRYKNEDLDAEQMKLKGTIVPEVKYKTSTIFVIFVMGTFWNMVCFPLSQLITVVEEERDHSQDLINPYLPQVMYTPFSTRNFFGYSAAYMMSVLLFLYVYGVVVCLNEIFVSCIVQLKVHLKILNHSIRNIHRRAYLMYRSFYGGDHGDIAQEDLFSRGDYQNCLYSCFRSNIQHHQALLKFKKEWQNVGGGTLLSLMTVGCFVYASFIYLSFQFQKLPVTLLASYVITLLVEIAYPYCNCLFGEEVIEESTTMFEELYGMPWMHCNKRFNRALNIVMTRSVEPIKVNALIINASASLDTYGDLITAAYKAANLVRQSDKY